jgi:hypothetical protein
VSAVITLTSQRIAVNRRRRARLDLEAWMRRWGFTFEDASDACEVEQFFGAYPFNPEHKAAFWDWCYENDPLPPHKKVRP